MNYAGIGSRKAPASILSEIHRLGQSLAEAGFLLRSGAADGADAAFEQGCDAASGAKQIFLPWPGFNGHASRLCRPAPEAFRIAGDHHPKWHYCKQAEQKLHARNAHQVLGPTLNDPVAFVLCWTQDGCEKHEDRTIKTGGTGTAISIASTRNVPVINLANPNAVERLEVIIRATTELTKAPEAAVRRYIR